MNLTSSLWGPGRNGNSASEYIAAWRHVVHIFRSRGVKNVSWVWSPNVDCSGKCPFNRFYPGDSYVDWVALDGYNYASVLGMPWESFAEVFSSSYSEMLAVSHKPFMVAETASTEVGGDKAAWIRQAFLVDLPSRFPQIRAAIWFDVDLETDWRVDSSPASLAAFRDVVASPLYGGM